MSDVTCGMCDAWKDAGIPGKTSRKRAHVHPLHQAAHTLDIVTHPSPLPNSVPSSKPVVTNDGIVKFTRTLELIKYTHLWSTPLDLSHNLRNVVGRP